MTLQKQYTDLFALAAEDDTSGVGRRGTSGRGRKPPPSKKDTNSTNSSNKKNSEPVYNSSDESSEVNIKAKQHFQFDLIQFPYLRFVVDCRRTGPSREVASDEKRR